MIFSARKKVSPFQILFCIFANFICFGLCYYLKFPVRLEHIGSLYAALSVGIGGGIFVAAVSQLIYALFYFGFSGILFLIPVILLLYFIVLAERCGWLETVIASLGAMTVAAIATTLITVLLSMLVGRNFMRNTCFLEMYDTLAAVLEYGKVKAGLLAVGGFRMLNVGLSWCLSALAWRLTPKAVGFGFHDHS